MRLMPKKCLMILLILLLAWPARPSIAAECSCSNTASADDAVFVGVVTGIDSPSMYGLLAAQVGALSRIPFGQGITFEVERAWRGVNTNAVSVRNGDINGCGYPFARGERYLVYASRAADGYLQTDVCQSTAPLAAAQAQLDMLSDEPTTPLRDVSVLRFLSRLPIFGVLLLLIYWWTFMVRAIRRSPQRF